MNRQGIRTALFKDPQLLNLTLSQKHGNICALASNPLLNLYFIAGDDQKTLHHEQG